MASIALMGAVDTLISIAAKDGFEIVRSDIKDLELSYSRLALLLSALQAERAGHAS
jgi:hypothetical protein